MKRKRQRATYKSGDTVNPARACYLDSLRLN